MTALATRILFVDDDRETREVMFRLLRRQVYDARAAGTCAQAIACLDAEPIDLLITDYLLPDGDGLAVLAHARKLYPIEGILVSGDTDIERTQEGLIREMAAAHFAFHLVKPVTFAELVGVIELLLEPCHRAALASRSVEALRSAVRVRTLREKVKTMTHEELSALSTALRRHGQDLREEIQVLGEIMRDGQSHGPVPSN